MLQLSFQYYNHLLNNNHLPLNLLQLDMLLFNKQGNSRYLVILQYLHVEYRDTIFVNTMQPYYVVRWWSINV